MAGKSWLVPTLLAAGLLLLVGQQLQWWHPQASVRYLLTTTVWEDQTVELDEYESAVRLDYSVHDGHIYSNKAPYQSLLTVPFFAAYRAAGGDVLRHGEGSPAGVWWLTFVSSAVPAAILLLLMRRDLLGSWPSIATPVALGLAVGTMLLPLASLLFGHLMTTLFVFAAWLLLRSPGASTGALVGAGTFAGLAVGVEYPTALVVLVVMGFAIAIHRWRSAIVAVAGVVAGLPLFAYQWAAFGAPWSVPQQHLTEFEGDGAFGVYNLVAPGWDAVSKALIWDRGLLVLTPIVTCALIGCVLAIRDRTVARPEAIIAILSLLLLFAAGGGIDIYGGGSPGPRYLAPALPFLARPLAEFWNRFPRVSLVAAAFGASWMILATLTKPIVDTDVNAPGHWLDRLGQLDFVPSVPGVLGPEWLVLVPTALGLCVLALARDLERNAIAAAGHEGQVDGTAPTGRAAAD